jgi:hypothetical protein
MKLTLQQFATETGTNPRTLATRLRKDRMSGQFVEQPGDRVGGVWYLERERWEQFAELREVGRPRTTS